MTLALPDAHRIHLWLIDGDDPGIRAACDTAWLSRRETGCMQACPGRADCTRYALARCLVRGVAARYLGGSPGTVALDEAIPGPAARLPGGYRLAWSQGERWLALAIGADRPLAVEVAPERITRGVRALRAAIAGPGEVDWLGGLPRRQRRAGLARLRALKVAWLRASGAGSEALGATAVMGADGRPLRRVECPLHGHWFTHDVEERPEGVRVAVAGEYGDAGRVPALDVRWLTEAPAATGRWAVPGGGAVLPGAPVFAMD